ncbi:MAG: hypothetical protein DRJ64_09225, partial [Thermoprotei archaeon]
NADCSTYTEQQVELCPSGSCINGVCTLPGGQSAVCGNGICETGEVGKCPDCAPNAPTEIDWNSIIVIISIPILLILSLMIVKKIK